MYDIEKMRFWCQKIIPLVYDDSMSYYETLCKVVKKLNEVIESVDNIPEYISELISAEHLQDILKTLLVNLENQIASANEELSETATADRPVGTLVWLDGDLYRATQYIDAGDRYVVDGNVEKITVEECIKDVMLALTDNYEDGERVASADRETGELVWFKNQLLLIKQDIEEGNAYTDANSEVVDFSKLFLSIHNQIVSEATARENADTALGQRIDDEATARENADTALSNGIASEATARENADTALGTRIDELLTKFHFATPQDYGAVGDGVTDDTTAITSLFGNEHNILITSGTYLITNRVSLYSDQLIIGQGDAKIKCGFENTSAIKVMGSNVKIINLTIEGIKGETAGSEYNHAIYLQNPHDVTIHSCTFKNMSGDGVYVGTDVENDIPSNVIIDDCLITNCGRNGISIIECDNFVIDSCIIEKTSGNNPQKAIDIEPNNNDFVIRGIVSNVSSYENVNGFLSVYLDHLGSRFNVKVCDCISEREGSEGYSPVTLRNNVDGQVGYLTLDNVSINYTGADAVYLSGFNLYFKLVADLQVNRLFGENAIVWWAQPSITAQGYADIRLHLNQPSGSFANAIKTVSNANVSLDNVMIDYISSRAFASSIESHHNVYVKQPYNDIDVWAYVATDGTLNWSNNADIVVTKIGTGAYTITGLSNIKAVVTNPRRSGNVISADIDSSDSRIVLSIFDLSGNSSDCAFYLHAKCSNTTFRKTFDDNYYKI